MPRLSYLEVIGFESGHLLHRDFQRLLEAGARWQWRPTIDLVEALRERKDPGELALIEAANGIATRALERTLPQVRVGMTELAGRRCAREGAARRGQRRLSLSVDRRIGAAVGAAARAIVEPRDRGGRLSAHGLRRRDGGLLLRRHADGRRGAGERRSSARSTRSFGRRMRRAARRVRAGMTGRDADAIARDYIEQRGYGDLFGHSLGHGLGLEVHEAPRLARTADGALAEGAVVTIEPGIYRPGWGGVRIEDDVFLGPQGAKILTSFTRELIELG